MKSTALLLISVLLPLAARGAEIQGKVVSAQGIPIAGAAVTISSDHHAPLTVTTTADGVYRIPDLQPGTYLVTVSLANSSQTLRREVSVPGASPARADFQLPPIAVEASSAAEEYNPNIFVFKIDQNELRNRLQTVRGADPQYVPDLTADQNYFGAEYGAPVMKFEPMRSRQIAKEWRGTAVGFLQNSALNARNFFNVGPLLPSRSLSYSLTGGGPLLSRKASLLLQLGHSHTSGWVNGNVQEPQAFERTALSSDPQVNAVVTGILSAYPLQLPNLPSVSPRQLNWNAQRNVNSRNAQARLDLRPGEDTTCAVRYSINDYSEDPFQIVIGSNPQTDLRAQTVHMSVSRTLSSKTSSQFGFNYDRLALLLQPTREFSRLLAAAGYSTVPDIQFSTSPSSYSELYNIGPGPQFPRRRVHNQFQFFSDLTRTMGNHAVEAGWIVSRSQVNDLQSDNARGTFAFGSDFGRTATQNFLHGTPSRFTQSLGNLYRGYRYWEYGFFIQDQIRITRSFTLRAGARYELMTSPVEVNHLSVIGLSSDRNNVAPRFGFAWNPRGEKFVVRGSYGISYGTIPPATIGFTRFNEPAIHVVTQGAPDLLTALNGGYQKTTRTARYLLSPDIVFPYSHQYGLSIERPLSGSTWFRLAYFGSRSFHLLTQNALNRAAPAPRPICNTPDPTRPCNNTKDIDDRRPDPRYFGIYMISGDSNAYYDAAQVSVDTKVLHGLRILASYTFSKAIDTGGDFTNNASNSQNINETGFPECQVCNYVSDRKGVSLFDTPQAATISYTYLIPHAFRGGSWEGAILDGWEISGSTVFQSGLPFHLHTGSDAAGFGNVDGEGHDRPNILNPSILGTSVDNPDTSASILKASNFNTILPAGGRGNLGMSTFRKKGTSNTNLALGRTYHLPGKRERTAQIRTEFYNLFNRAQFDKPGPLLSSTATFGKITNTVNKGRQVQLSLRLDF